MNVAILTAGGIGSRTHQDLPKQFNSMDNSALNNEKIKERGYRDSFSVREGLYRTVKILADLL